LAPRSTPAVHQIRVFLFELAQARLDIGERHVLGVWDMAHPSLQGGTDIDYLEILIVFVVGYHFLCFGDVDAHY
jgi:hypothetical protein